ncbi:MAG: hypothetical protein KBT45_01780 [Bacteroidales bacterium]|nr:hypothetical protein [Candidatus Colimorpha pelethequi]
MKNHNKTVYDTVMETVKCVLYDTIRETTTITIQTNAAGDTTKLISTHDHEKITSRDNVASQSHSTSQAETQTIQNASKSDTLKTSNSVLTIKMLVISFLWGMVFFTGIMMIRKLRH